MRVAVIGYSGSGKSTFSAFLSQKFALPVLYLDQVQWLPNWREQVKEKKLKAVEDFLFQNESWVIDGNYSNLFYEERMERADKIVFLNFNRFSCFFRAYKRYRKNKGRTRENMTEGCEEKFDKEFIRWILKDGRGKTTIERYRSVKSKYPDKVIEVKNQRQLDLLCERVKKGNF